MNLTARVDVDAPPETVFAAVTDGELWDAPSRCEARHIGWVVRGSGIFAVQPRAAGGATFEWTERLELILGALDRLGRLLVRPIFGWGLQRSLDRFACFCRDYPR